MRRVSQRNGLVTLNEINITPLLDLAFVLLIIFIIATPLLEQSLELKLPQGGGASRKIPRESLATAEVDPRGLYVLNGRRIGGFDAFEQALRELHRRNTNIVVNLRADKTGAYEHPFKIMNLCQRLGVPISLATEAERTRR